VSALWEGSEAGRVAVPALCGPAYVEPRMSDGIGRTADAAAQVVRDHGPMGLPAVLWTLVVFAALWRGDAATLHELWPYLFWTWIGLIGMTVASAIGLSVLRSRAPRKVPHVAVAPITPRNDERPELDVGLT
jgi:hypothetical protein